MYLQVDEDVLQHKPVLMALQTGGDTECRVSSRAMDSVQCRTCQIYSGNLLKDCAGQVLQQLTVPHSVQCSVQYSC